jgi:hypothetical protein
VSLANDLICPTNQNHGELYIIRDDKSRFYCPHIDHLGRSEGHPAGFSEPTPAFFGRSEVVAANARYAGEEAPEEFEPQVRTRVARSTPGARAKVSRPKARVSA